ncbi:MAG: hypothetical protein AAB308_08100 [Nitrospirota bacterium]|jgi:hypothetical protein
MERRRREGNRVSAMAWALPLLPALCLIPTVATTQDLTEPDQTVIRGSPADD